PPLLILFICAIGGIGGKKKSGKRSARPCGSELVSVWLPYPLTTIYAKINQSSLVSQTQTHGPPANPPICAIPSILPRFPKAASRGGQNRPACAIPEYPSFHHTLFRQE